MKVVNGEKMYTWPEIGKICEANSQHSFDNYVKDGLIDPDIKTTKKGYPNLYKYSTACRAKVFKELLDNGFSRAVASAIINDPAIVKLPDWWFKQVAEYDETKTYYYPVLIVKNKRLTKKETLDVTCLAMAGEVAAHMKELFSTSKKATEFDKIQIINLKPIFDRVAQGIARLEDELGK